MTPGQLYEDHRQLEVLFEDLDSRAEAKQWWLCDEVWDELTKRLEAHMAFEEREVFPRLLMEHRGLLDDIRRLLQEHEEIRAAAFRIGVELQFHRLDPDEVAALVARLRAHAEVENRIVYPRAARTTT